VLVIKFRSSLKPEILELLAHRFFPEDAARHLEASLRPRLTNIASCAG
jgi:hypothetical protein